MAPKSLAVLAGLVAVFFDTTQAGPVETRSDVPAGYYVPPYYPAPYGGWIESWADSYDKAKALVDEMTLAEKVNITSGTGIYMGKHLV
jgi:beta-glucosidase